MLERFRKFARAIADGKPSNIKWLTNIFKDKAIHFMEHCTEYATFEGSPKATDTYTVEQLEKVGIVGIYTDTRKPKKLVRVVSSCPYCINVEKRQNPVKEQEGNIQIRI